jgi:hypothetical protein
MAVDALLSTQHKPPSVGIYGIFMGQYAELLAGFMENLSAMFLPEYQKVFYLVLDDAELCRNLTGSNTNVQCVVKELLPWPYPTLLRWAYFLHSFP